MLPANFSQPKFFRSLILLILGFSSGLPLALTSGTLQAWATVEKVDLMTIGFMSLIGQAYVFKCLWAPAMDRYKLPWLGRRRGWLVLTQVALGGLIAVMGCLNPAKQLSLLTVFAFLVAFFSASQDIVFDAWKSDTLAPAERGKGAAISVLGYRLAMLVSGGLALWLADRYLGWQKTYWLMALLMLPGIITTYLAREANYPDAKTLSLVEAITFPLQDFFKRNNVWLMITLIICYKLGDAFASTLAGPFLIRGLNFSVADVGLVNKTLGLVATISGALYAGCLMQKMSLFRSLMLFGILQAIANLCYWLLAVTPPHLASMGMAVFVENLCSGMGTAAFVALLMALCHSGYSATQFALFSALSAVARVYVGPFAGWLADSWGWAWFYAFSIAAGIPGLIILYFSRSSLNHAQDNLFATRTRWLAGYHYLSRCFYLGCLSLTGWILLLLLDYLKLPIPTWLTGLLFMLGLGVIVLTVITGVVLDCLSLRKKANAGAIAGNEAS